MYLVKRTRILHITFPSHKAIKLEIGEVGNLMINSSKNFQFLKKINLWVWVQVQNTNRVPINICACKYILIRYMQWRWNEKVLWLGSSLSAQALLVEALECLLMSGSSTEGGRCLEMELMQQLVAEASLLLSLNLPSQSSPSQSHAATTSGLVLADKITTTLR